jgi:hypothetical protein
MVSSPVQIVPTLTILEDEGEFTVRVGSQGNAAAIAQAVVPLLAGLGARKLLLITPMDTKVFKFDGVTSKPESGANPAPSRRIIADQGAPPTPDEADAEYERYRQQEAEAERIAQEQASTACADPGLPDQESAETPVKRTKARVLPTQNLCGRCAGGGTLEGGGPCPVCKGSGKVAQWGRKTR